MPITVSRMVEASYAFIGGRQAGKLYHFLRVENRKKRLKFSFKNRSA